MENPATASWGLDISDEDFTKLKRGIKPRDWDSRWIFRDMTEQELLDAKTIKDIPAGELETTELTEDEQLEEIRRDEAMVDEDEDEDEGPLDLHQGGDISFRRTWTNIELYRLVISLRNHNVSAKITAITWEQHPNSRISEEQAKIDAVLLCRSIVGCDLSAAPAYETELFSDLRTTYPSTTVENGTAAENGM